MLNKLKNIFLTFKIPFVAVSLFLGILLINLVFVISDDFSFGKIDREAFGQLGCFVGGYVGAYFTLCNVILLFITFRDYRRAYTKQSFETHFFELLKMHRENVSELQVEVKTDIKVEKGRKVFVLLYREFRFILQGIAEIESSFSNEDKCIIAYCCLYYGTGRNSTRLLKNALSTYDKNDFVNKLLDKIKNYFETLDPIENDDKNWIKHDLFGGHITRLRHLFLHLFETFNYVDANCTDANEKEKYFKIIRAQLSLHEQSLLLFHSISHIAGKWSKDILLNYNIPQNFPLDFVDSEKVLDIKQLFNLE
jgi:hypothetical protein